MSFAHEIKDFVSGFKSGWDMADESQKDKAAREEREGLKAAQLDAENKAGGYGGPASTALPGGSSVEGSVGKLQIERSALPSMAQGDNADTSGVLRRASEAVSGIESGGRYDILGPKHPKYGYAVGKYQVMESNIPSWTREALGREMTTQEFRSSPEAQEKVFQHRFGGYLQKTGSVSDAASMWHSGRPLAKARAAGARDSLGTRTEDYARKVERAVGRRADAAIPVEDDDATQFAAEGGRVRSRDELEAEEARTLSADQTAQRGRLRRPADAPFMPGPRVQGALRGEGEPAETYEPDEAQEVTPVRAIPDEAPTVGAGPRDTVRTETPAGTVRSTDEQSVPLPPARPSADELSTAPRQSRPADMPAEGAQPATAQVTRPGKGIPDNGAPLPGEYMGAGPGQESPQVDPRRFVNTGTTAQASQGVLGYIGEFLGLKSAGLPSATAGYDQNVRKLTQYAATPAEVREVDRTIDPRGELAPAARAVARMNAGYEFYLQRGEPEKALKYAASMVLYARSHSMMAGRMAQAALKAGDVPGAARVIQEAHNQAPDGQAIEVTKAGPQGVEYAMTDLDGNLTQRGRASVDELMHLATGMQNGSVWLEQMAELTRMKPAGLSPSQRLRQQESERKQRTAEEQQAARNEFDDAATPESDEFLASLNEQQRAAYSRMDARGKGRVRREWSSEQKRKLAEAKVDSATVGKERAAQDEQEYAGYANRISEAEEALARQMQADPDDKIRVQQAQEAVTAAREAARQWSESDPGRAKLGDKLRGGASRGGRQGIPTAPAYGEAPRGATKEQKREAALDVEERRSFNNTYRDGPPMKESWDAHEATRADVGFRRATEDGPDTETARAIDETAAQRGMKFTSEDDKFAVRQAGEEIARGNGMLPDQAVRFVQAALDANGKYRVTRDGKVQFGDAPPIRLGRGGLLAIAGILGRRDKAQQGATPQAANPFQPETRAGAQMRQEDEAQARVQTERQTAENAGNARARTAKLESELRRLGGEPQPGMSVEQLEREINDQKRLNARGLRDRALPGF